jgi:hypothetical protein
MRNNRQRCLEFLTCNFLDKKHSLTLWAKISQYELSDILRKF